MPHYKSNATGKSERNGRKTRHFDRFGTRAGDFVRAPGCLARSMPQQFRSLGQLERIAQAIER
jgi:hypothetical protein